MTICSARLLGGFAESSGHAACSPGWISALARTFCRHVPLKGHGSPSGRPFLPSPATQMHRKRGQQGRGGPFWTSKKADFASSVQRPAPTEKSERQTDHGEWLKQRLCYYCKCLPPCRKRLRVAGSGLAQAPGAPLPSHDGVEQVLRVLAAPVGDLRPPGSRHDLGDFKRTTTASCNSTRTNYC